MTAGHAGKDKKRKKAGFAVFIIMLECPFAMWGAVCMHRLLQSGMDLEAINVNFGDCIHCFFQFRDWMPLYFFGIIQFGILCLLLLGGKENHGIASVAQQQVTDNLSIPTAVGSGQHGTARFLTEREKQSVFASCDSREVPPGKGGIVLQMKRKKKEEVLLYMNMDVHSLIVGATRSGKTRRIILESIWNIARFGESMVISDPKGELFYYTKDYLEQEGYEVIDFDLRNPARSKHYNYMQPILDAIDEGDMPAAIDYTWDIVSVFVGETKGEPLWQNGESSTIAAAILIVALDAPPKYRNMANVYFFISYMCQADDEGKMPLNEYLQKLPDTHPAKGVFAMAQIASWRTRSSFFTSALGSLKLFANWNMAEVTSKSDFTFDSIGARKTAMFLIIPDEKTTLYGLASIFVNQAYVSLVRQADRNGGRLLVDINFLLDEFGNFPRIPSFGSMLSVGAGRGIRFNIVLQDFQQLKKNYEKDYDNVKGNCQLWIYLKSPNKDTQEEISKKLGNYTVQVNSSNSSTSSGKTASSSHSANASLTHRALLTPDEVGRLQAPYSLVMLSGEYPAIMYSPDLNRYSVNRILGLGDQEHNQKVIMEREKARKERKIKEPRLWGIWKGYQCLPDADRVSFLDLD